MRPHRVQFAIEYSGRYVGKGKMYFFKTNHPMSAESVGGLNIYSLQNYIRKDTSAEVLKYGWMCGTRLTSGDYMRNDSLRHRIMWYHHAATSFRRHYEKLMDEDRTSLTGACTPNDECYRNFSHSTGVPYMMYLDRSYKGLDDGGVGVIVYNERHVFEEVPLWDPCGFAYYMA